MSISRTVVIWGNSLLLAGIEAGLRGKPGLQVLHLAPAGGQPIVPLPEAHVIVYDLAQAGPGLVPGWLAERPHVTLIGLDADHDRVQIVTGLDHKVLAVGDITRLVLQAAGDDIT